MVHHFDFYRMFSIGDTAITALLKAPRRLSHRVLKAPVNNLTRL